MNDDHATTWPPGHPSAKRRDEGGVAALSVGPEWVTGHYTLLSLASLGFLDEPCRDGSRLLTSGTFDFGLILTRAQAVVRQSNTKTSLVVMDCPAAV